MRHIRLSTLGVAALATACVTGLGPGLPAGAAPPSGSSPAVHSTQPSTGPAAQRQPLRTDLRRWTSDRQLRRGDRAGVIVRRGSLRIGDPIGVRTWTDPYGDGRPHRYAYGRWVSPWARADSPFRELVPSWSATTPRGTWLQAEVRVRTTSGRRGSWDGLGRWASGTLRGFHRTSQGTQDDDVASVATDTVRAHANARGWQLRLVLHRRVGSGRTPVVDATGATTSTPAPTDPRTSRPGRARGTVIGVPRYSQMIHQGHYPQWDNGGEAWCSPTSVAMVLASWGSGPTRRQYGWVPDGHRDPWVDHAARMTYDHRYRGTGNWSFSAAYAGTFGLDAFVTRLGSLRAAERYIAAGIPLVLSIAFGPGELDGSPLTSTGGHLVVLRGFTEQGRPIVNDPAAARDRGVRRVYARGQLEDAWLTASAGTAYVVRPGSHPLPRH